MFFPCVKEAYPLEAVPDFAGLLADYLWCDDEDETPQAAENSGLDSSGVGSHRCYTGISIIWLLLFIIGISTGQLI